jgi:hypothetical protein
MLWIAKTVGTLWAAPWSGTAFVATVGPLWGLRQIAYHSLDPSHGVVRFVVRPDTLLSRILVGYSWGISLGSFQIFSSERAVSDLCSHENVHTRQAWVFGPFFPLLYAGAHAVLWVQEGDWERAYERNPFELDARCRE